MPAGPQEVVSRIRSGMASVVVMTSGKTPPNSERNHFLRRLKSGGPRVPQTLLKFGDGGFSRLAEEVADDASNICIPSLFSRRLPAIRWIKNFSTRNAMRPSICWKLWIDSWPSWTVLSDVARLSGPMPTGPDEIDCPHLEVDHIMRFGVASVIELKLGRFWHILQNQHHRLDDLAKARPLPTISWRLPTSEKAVASSAAANAALCLTLPESHHLLRSALRSRSSLSTCTTPANVMRLIVDATTPASS